MGPIILASGIIGLTVVAVLASESRLVAVGPLLMAIALFAVGVPQYRVDGAPRARIWVALIMGCAIVLAAVIVVQRDPAHVASLVPILGGALDGLVGVNPSSGSGGGNDAAD